MASDTCKVENACVVTCNSDHHVTLPFNWEEIICPICLDIPHNCVLLQCSSYEKGCQPFVCNTGHMHSNCLDRFKAASGMHSVTYAHCASDSVGQLLCPLCRGFVSGWIVIEAAQVQMNAKKRSCQNCPFLGTYYELDRHAKLSHPHARPTEVDPAQQLDWENFQQSSEIIDVLSTIHSEVPRGVVLGDYVIEYEEEEMADEYDDFPGDDGNWWTSCILYQVFDTIRTSRNRRRSRDNQARRQNRGSGNDISPSDDSPGASLHIQEYRMDEDDDEFVITRIPRGSSSHRSYRRHRSRFYDH